MNYREHRGLRISEIGIGSYSLSGVFGPKDKKEFFNIFRRAVELGVNYFDTAPSYGDDTESIIGEALEPLKEKVFLSTKVGVSEGREFDLSAKSIRLSCEKSLKATRRERIDFLQVHFDDDRTSVEEVINCMELLKKEGKILHYGVGHLPPQKIEEYLKSGDPFSVMMEFSPVSRSARLKLFPLLEKFGVKGVAFSVTGRGMLSMKNIPESFPEGDIRNIDPLFQRDFRASCLRIREKFSRVAEKYGKSLAQVAISWVLSHPPIICALCGPSSIAHLEENIQASGWIIPAEDLRELENFLKEEEGRLKEERLKSAKEILRQSEISDSDRVSLIYAVDALIEYGLLPEKDGFPIFLQILDLEKMDPMRRREAQKDIVGRIRRFWQ